MYFADGYVAVDHVELDITEMLELGKKTAITRTANSNVVDGEVTSTGSRCVFTVGDIKNRIDYTVVLKGCVPPFVRASNHYPLSADGCKYHARAFRMYPPHSVGVYY